MLRARNRQPSINQIGDTVNLLIIHNTRQGLIFLNGRELIWQSTQHR